MQPIDTYFCYNSDLNSVFLGAYMIFPKSERSDDCDLRNITLHLICLSLSV